MTQFQLKYKFILLLGIFQFFFIDSTKKTSSVSIPINLELENRRNLLGAKVYAPDEHIHIEERDLEECKIGSIIIEELDVTTKNKTIKGPETSDFIIEEIQSKNYALKTLTLDRVQLKNISDTVAHSIEKVSIHNMYFNDFSFLYVTKITRFKNIRTCPLLKELHFYNSELKIDFRLNKEVYILLEIINFQKCFFLKSTNFHNQHSKVEISGEIMINRLFPSLLSLKSITIDEKIYSRGEFEKKIENK